MQEPSFRVLRNALVWAVDRTLPTTSVWTEATFNIRKNRSWQDTHLSRQKAYAWCQDAETIHQRYLRDHPSEKQPSLSGNQKSKRSKAAGKCVRNSHLERAWNKGQKGLGGRRPLQSLIINTLEHLPLSGTASWRREAQAVSVLWLSGKRTINCPLTE